MSLPPEFVAPPLTPPPLGAPEEVARELGPGPHPPDIRRLNILTEGLQPPTALWVTPDDLLIAGVRNSVAGVNVAVNGRLWLPGGDFANVGFTAVPGSVRALQFFQSPLQYGYLVSAVAYATGTMPKRGQCLVSLQVARPPFSAFLIYWFMGQDYLTSLDAVYWPGGRNVPGVEGPGFVRAVTIGAPAAGTDWSQTVPTGARWRIKGVRARLTTSAALGSRFPRLQIDDGVTIFLELDTNVPQAPSTIFSHQWAPPGTTTEIQIADQNRPLPLGWELSPGHVIHPVTTSLAAGDQWDAARLFVEEVIED